VFLFDTGGCAQLKTLVSLLLRRVCVFVTVCCSMLQYVAVCSVCYSMLQSVDSLLLKGTPIQLVSLPIIYNSYLFKMTFLILSFFAVC